LDFTDIDGPRRDIRGSSAGPQDGRKLNALEKTEREKTKQPIIKGGRTVFYGPEGRPAPPRDRRKRNALRMLRVKRIKRRGGMTSKEAIS